MENYLEFKKFLSTKNSIDLLKLISLLQVSPENHGNNLRLEIIQSIIINNLNQVNDSFNYDGVVNAINDMFPSDYREDPVETSFTDNLLFLNGNNIVFPGIVKNSNEIIEGLITAVLLTKNSLPEDVKNIIREGVLFMLIIHNNIAKKLKLQRYISNKNNETEIFFPDKDFFEANKELFSFSKADIEKIYFDFNIKNDVLVDFLFDNNNEEIDIENTDKNPLLLKPFIKVNDIYYLVLPTSELYAIDNYIINKLEETEMLGEVISVYDKMFVSETRKQLLKIGWKITDINEKIKNNIKLDYFETIWQFDENKLAYVSVLPNSKEYIRIEERANTVISNIKSIINDEDYNYLSVIITSTYSSINEKFYGFESIKEADQIIVLSIFDLSKLISHWNIDKLSFWKFAKSKEIAFKTGLITLFPYSILTYYSWYTKNHNSFFHSDENYGSIFFDFSIQGNVIIDDNIKNDKHGVISFKKGRGYGYVPVYKSVKYAPIYTSEEIYFGVYKKVIEVLSFPIWVSTHKEYDALGKHFVDAIVYWLFELSKPLQEYFHTSNKRPIEIILSFDEKLYDFTPNLIVSNESGNCDINFEIESKTGYIVINIPFEMYSSLYRIDNYAERKLMFKIIESISKLTKLSLDEKLINNIIDRYIPLGQAKMILTTDSSRNYIIDDRYIPRVRYIQEADASYVLENIVTWLDYVKPIPEKIKKKKEKIKLLVEIVNILITKIRQELKKYDTIELLKFLLYHHEAIIQKQEYSKLYIPARIACYSKYKNVLDEFIESESDIINISLASRTLIEFVIAEPYFEKKKPNNDDVDYLLALMHQILYFGNVQDSIRFELDNPEIGLLKSGRIGVSKDFYEDILVDYNHSSKEDELVEYIENFERMFNRKDDVRIDKKISTYNNKVDDAFKSDWGISLIEIYKISESLYRYCFSKEYSYCIMNEKDFLSLLKEEFKIPKEIVDAFLSIVTLLSRGLIDKEPNGYIIPEILPWRYGRKLSYLRKPLIKMDNGKEVYYLWGARFMLKASEHLIQQIYDASLRVESNNHRVINMIANQNNRKGKIFREKVYEELKKSPDLTIVPFEVKINTKSILVSDIDYGDIDILAFNDSKKIIYSIECKNTKQAKIIYDFQRDVRNYLNKQLPKHIRRDKWLKKNRFQLSKLHSKNVEKYKVKSLVIASYQLPVKFMKEVEIPIYSFNQIKKMKIF